VTSVEYDTADPARIQLDVDYGTVRIVATERSTTAVTVRPSAAGRRADVELAGKTQVDLIGGVVTVAVPHWRLSSLLRPGAIEIVVEAPTGSSVSAVIGYAHFSADGVLGRCQVRSSYGNVRIDTADQVEVTTSGGQVVVGLVREVAELTSSYGLIRVADVRGRCDLRNSTGDVLIGTARDAVRIQSVYGQITVERAVSGELDIVTSYGATEVGIADGTAVRLDVTTKNGQLINALTPSATPRDPTPRLELRARSGYGDVTIRRSLRHQGEG
jgi:hypothetical protein